MGTWSWKLKGNDTFLDIYQAFFEAYNNGQDPAEISAEIRETFTEMFNDDDDRNNCLFGLALAQWETKSLERELHLQVNDIIASGNDLNLWKDLGADEKLLQKRRKELDDFLLKLRTEREKAKRRIRSKHNFRLEKLLVLPANDGQKVFEICESYVNDIYQDTHAMMNWATGGGSIFYFYTKGKPVTARWIDDQILEIRHDETISFVKKDETFFFRGDKGIIKYIPE